MDPQHYSPYHHPYYRVGTAGVKDHHHHHHQSVESAAQAAAVQTRILEMRKEKSRDAARSRRGKENHEFYELAKMLPLPAAITSQLDKASIIRLTISYLKLRDFAMNGEPSWSLNGSTGNSTALKCNKNCNVFDIHQGTHILQSLDGFAFALGQDGRFLYISETVSIYLGLSQVEMTGSSIFDYTHQQDHAELAEHLGISQSVTSGSHHHHHQLSSSPLPPASVGSSASNESEPGAPYSSSNANHIQVSSPTDTMERQFCMRMKSTLTKRGCQHFKSSGYRVVHIIAHLRPEIAHHHHQQRSRDTSGTHPSGGPKIIGLVAVAIALPPPSINELRLESDMFVTRLSLDFRIAHCEPRVSDLLDYSSEELTGRNLYSLVHGQDVMQIRKCHLDLIHKGQVMSGYYRLINKTGGFTWLQTCATLICSNSNNKSTASSTTTGQNSSTTPEEQEQSIICVNYVLSLIEYSDVILDSSQLNGGVAASSPTTIQSKRTSMATTIPKRSLSPSPSPEPNSSQHSQNNSNSQLDQPPPPPSTSSTSSQANGSPGSPVDQVNDGAKRRRFNSSPVRPWKSPSPPAHAVGGGVHGQQTSGGGTNGSSSASNLLRHISVIRETPPILKPQVVPPAYHPHPYHHLVDPYAAAYHLYKNGGTGPVMGHTATHAAGGGPSPAGHHHWGAYN